MNETCIKCGAVLDKDDIGAHKKLVDRGAQSYMCVKCLARHFDVTEQKIREKIAEFRAQGCLLFK
ncbi:MAG: hypothetical protein IJK33_07925 [Clostridia bacterium]|nr:hypothetical protein [Clostridia bacterium]